jgi:hypothetical protein
LRADFWLLVPPPMRLVDALGDAAPNQSAQEPLAVVSAACRPVGAANLLVLQAAAARAQPEGRDDCEQ